MSGAFKSGLLMLLVALLPLRGLAAATLGLCAFAHQHGSEAMHAQQHEHSASPDGHSHAQPHGGSPCSSCAEHCSGSAFAPPTANGASVAASVSERCITQARLALGLRAEPLDRPPLSR